MTPPGEDASGGGHIAQLWRNGKLSIRACPLPEEAPLRRRCQWRKPVLPAHLQSISINSRFAPAVIAAGGGNFLHPAKLGGFAKAVPGDPQEFQRKNMTTRETTIHWTCPGRFEGASSRFPLGPNRTVGHGCEACTMIAVRPLGHNDMYPGQCSGQAIRISNVPRIATMIERGRPRGQ